jgi:GT2 family glycosyltransferase
MGEPFISIVIPTRGRDDALALCLERLRPQAVPGDIEVIVTDDGTEPSTREMLAARFDFARWTSGPRRGPAANRNHGASIARGLFLLFIDDDVVPSPTLVEGYRAAISDDYRVYEGRTTCLAGLHSPLEVSPINMTGGWLWSCNLMIHRALWQHMGGFDEDFRYPHLEDVALRERLRAEGESFLFVPTATVDHPPRRVAPARRRAAFHESEVIYEYKYERRRPSLARFLLRFANYHLRYIGRAPLGRDSAVALGSRLVEAFYVARAWRGWREKHQGLKREAERGKVAGP